MNKQMHTYNVQALHSITVYEEDVLYTVQKCLNVHLGFSNLATFCCLEYTVVEGFFNILKECDFFFSRSLSLFLAQLRVYSGNFALSMQYYSIAVMAQYHHHRTIRKATEQNGLSTTELCNPSRLLFSCYMCMNSCQKTVLLWPGFWVFSRLLCC